VGLIKLIRQTQHPVGSPPAGQPKMLELKTAAFISASRLIIGAVEYRQSSSIIVNHSSRRV
jgi:hypothetical protein